ncbi:putative motility protein YjfB-like [Salsuginibacillus halophilus]|uniref:Putative motility protein YjfB-like n=1 Tax=Salsuginibacillus halophilus TaxID=517424 RepID=A0A2P8HQV3_9BACI|nr:YjfB family protein [Salsuginibacillus halophilus]PSL48601.1 putative motility protein YjfB-like [Salsuginibacillus halophilus]
MDIAAHATLASQMQVKQQSSLQLMDKAMDQGERQIDLLDEMQKGDAAAKQVQQAAEPGKGGNIDVTV